MNKINQAERITKVLESNNNFDRIRTHINDQNAVREYYMEKVSLPKSVAALEIQIDLIIDIILMFLDSFDEENLTNEQKLNLEKIKLYHKSLSSLTLQDNIWELDWIYSDVKLEANLLRRKFFEKRTELNLGEPLV